MSTTDGRKLLLGVKNLFKMNTVQDAFSVAETYGDGKIHKIDYTYLLQGFPTSNAYFYYIVLTDTTKVDEYVSRPWNLAPPNDSKVSVHLGLLDGHSVNVSSSTTVKSIAKNILKPAFDNPRIFNEKDTNYSDYISQTQFNDNDFELTNITTDSGSYPLLFFVSKKDNADKKDILGVTNKGKIESAYIILQPTQQFFVRCCVETVQSSTNDQEGSRKFCPSGYKDSGSACTSLMNDYCVKSSKNTKNYLKPVCGCYEDYIQEVIVDKDDSVQKMLKELGISKLPNGCVKSCQKGKAYIEDRQTCDVVICKSEINNSGVFNVDHFDSNQNCTSSSKDTSTDSNTNNNTDNGNGSTDTDNGSTDNGNGSTDNGGSSTDTDNDNNKGNKALLYGLIIGGSVIGFLVIILLLYALM